MKISIGDIFVTKFASFYEVVRTTAKTVTVRPIEDEFVGYADSYGWEKEYKPIKGAFCENGYWPREVCERGKRCKVYDWTQAQNMPQIKITDTLDAYLYNGGTAILDTYS